MTDCEIKIKPFYQQLMIDKDKFISEMKRLKAFEVELKAKIDSL